MRPAAFTSCDCTLSASSITPESVPVQTTRTQAAVNRQTVHARTQPPRVVGQPNRPGAGRAARSVKSSPARALRRLPSRRTAAAPEMQRARTSRALCLCSRRADSAACPTNHCRCNASGTGPRKSSASLPRAGAPPVRGNNCHRPRPVGCRPPASRSTPAPGASRR